MGELDAKSRLLLNALQAGLPLAERPFKALGEQAGLSENEVLARLGQFKTGGILRQVSAIFDTRALGYQSCLAACKVAPERLDAAAAIINRHPGVSHNYARNHEFNLWFTIAVPPGSSLEAHADALRRECGAETIRLLPALRVFKIGVQLDMADDETHHRDTETQRKDTGYRMQDGGRTAPHARCRALDDGDIRCVRALQKEMPAQAEPFAPIAAEAGLGTAELFAWCREAMRRGRLRRIAGVLRHRAAGFHGNGMGVWNAPPERIEELGAFFAAQKAVTHCYQRLQYPDWPYSLFTMVHAKTVAACDAAIADLARQTGIREYAVLYSTKEYKKIRLLYFTGEIEAWERAHGVRR